MTNEPKITNWIATKLESGTTRHMAVVEGLRDGAHVWIATALFNDTVTLVVSRGDRRRRLTRVFDSVDAAKAEAARLITL